MTETQGVPSLVGARILAEPGSQVRQQPQTKQVMNQVQHQFKGLVRSNRQGSQRQVLQHSSGLSPGLSLKRLLGPFGMGVKHKRLLRAIKAYCVPQDP